MKEIGFLLFEQYHGKYDIGSSRIRGHYLINHMPEAEAYKLGRAYKAIVYQKAYWFEHAESFDGLKILDLCDPDFLHWGYPVKRMIDAVDGVTCSSLALAEAVSKLTDKPVAFIRDRFDLATLPHRGGRRIVRKHDERPTEVAVWYGYSQNFPLLDSAVPALVKAGIKKIIVITDRKNPYKLPVGMDGKIELVNYPFKVDTYMEDIMLGDIVVNPRSESGHWKFKSENKTALSWLLGMPVVATSTELKAMMTYEARVKESKMRLAQAEKEYDVRESVQELKEFMQVCQAV